MDSDECGTTTVISPLSSVWLLGLAGSCSVLLGSCCRDAFPLLKGPGAETAPHSARWLLPHRARTKYRTRQQVSGRDHVTGGNIIVSDHGPDNQPPHDQSRESSQELPQRQPGSTSDAAMGADMNADAVHIPQPRSPVDDQSYIPVPPPSERLPGRPPGRPGQPGRPEFQYKQTWKRGKHRRYHGFVERVGGAEGERLREDLAVAIRDLLDWAAQQDCANGPDSTHGPDGTRGADLADCGESDDGADSGEGGRSA